MTWKRIYVDLKDEKRSRSDATIAVLSTFTNKATVCVHVTLDDSINEMVELKDVAMTQLPINVNDNTTWHKL